MTLTANHDLTRAIASCIHFTYNTDNVLPALRTVHLRRTDTEHLVVEATDRLALAQHRVRADFDDDVPGDWRLLLDLDAAELVASQWGKIGRGNVRIDLDDGRATFTVWGTTKNGEITVRTLDHDFPMLDRLFDDIPATDEPPAVSGQLLDAKFMVKCATKLSTGKRDPSVRFHNNPNRPILFHVSRGFYGPDTWDARALLMPQRSHEGDFVIVPDAGQVAA